MRRYVESTVDVVGAFEGIVVTVFERFFTVGPANMRVRGGGNIGGDRKEGKMVNTQRGILLRGWRGILKEFLA